MENRAATETSTAPGTKTPQTSEANSLRGPQGPQDLDEIIAAACAGDRAALNRLLADARPRLLAVALRMLRDRDDAEDVVQESLLKVCRHITRFEGRSAFSTWMHRIVVNAALDRLRRHGSRPDRALGGAGGSAADTEEPALPTPDAVDHETPERAVGRAEASAVVRLAIAALSPSHQEAIALREIDGESYQSIARIARVPVGTVMSRLFHARRKLTEQLAAQDDVPSLCAA